ncbi:hypothetical protein BJ508DRAFT_18579 [Ascobolus immersus RN42]|uniref:Uncharacterized protein n=1 Tax=Ascobolus immersus RN42 TaxID=1160509 RepID=A0A3N4HNS4_ASCIM|nr:hypothetical protein BJ508DRAFT_18579 [Ascobolus immersus RN42]
MDALDIIILLSRFDVEGVLKAQNLRSIYPSDQVVTAIRRFLEFALKTFGALGNDRLYERLYDIGLSNNLLPDYPEYIRSHRLGVRQPGPLSYRSFFRPKLHPCDGAAPPISIPLPTDACIIGSGVVCFGFSKALEVIAVEVLVSSTYQDVEELQNRLSHHNVPVVIIRGTFETSAQEEEELILETARKWAYGSNERRWRSTPKAQSMFHRNWHFKKLQRPVFTYLGRA